MLTGKKFKLDRTTLALDVVEGRRRTVAVPAGEIIKIVDGPTSNQDRMVDILWQGRVLTMFALDVDARGTEISESEPLSKSARA